ncbi:MAG: prolyl-tRNA synthetase associated domain-containing protein, partial [Clostridia bacterium]|nr:prolyl-tRNA synthetase associated domain-containing protein [Clostridia bacterium]
MIMTAGRPQSTEGRLPREMRVYDFLDGLGVQYDRVDHEPAATMADCAEVDRALGAPICKNLFLRNRQGTKFWLLLMPGDKPFKTKELS